MRIAATMTLIVALGIENGIALAADSALEARLLDHARAIAAAPRPERGAVISGRLRRLGISCAVLPVPGGSNLEVRIEPASGIGKEDAAGRLILGAHLDRAPAGEGAVDNAASCAVLIELAGELGNAPPAAEVRILFFDREEEGLRGSRAYLEGRVDEINLVPRTGYFNLDINAYGDTIIYGPLGAARGRMAAILELAARLEDLPALGLARYPPGDDISFRRAGIDAVSSAILPRAEAVELEAFLSGRSGEPPEILKVIHSDRDRIERVDPEALVRVLRLARRVGRLSGRPMERF
jgi:hypothetical protein